MDNMDIFTLVIASLAFLLSVYDIIQDKFYKKKINRSEFLKSLFSDFSAHNWSFIEHWDFPGIYPPMEDIREIIPNKSEEYKEPFGSRVVTLEHLNILMKVFTYKKYLTKNDIEGFRNWGQGWFDRSGEALKTIFASGDTYPLDFIIWLRDNIFDDTQFQKVFGEVLRVRLHDFEKPNRRI